MVFGWGDSEDAHQQVYGQDDDYDNKGKFSHELIAGAASFEGFKLFEDHQRAEGKPVSHAFAKELLAGFAGGEVDKLAETHGMNEYDRLRAHHQAKENAEKMYDDHYIQGHGADQYNPSQYGAPSQFKGGRGRGMNDSYGQQGGYDQQGGYGQQGGDGYGQQGGY